MRWFAELAIPVALAAALLPAHGTEISEGDILVTLTGAVAKVDPATGVQTILSASPPDFAPVGNGPALRNIDGIAVDCNGQIVVSDYFADNLMRINPVTGDRVAVSGCADSSGAPGCPIVGAGPFTGGRPLVGIGVEQDGNLITSYIELGLVMFRVNPVTGDRTIVSSNIVGDGPLPTSGGVTLENDGNILTWGAGLVRVDPLTGDRETVSVAWPWCNPEDCVGEGIDFWYVGQSAVAADGTILAAQDGTPGRAHGVVAIDPVTGDRSLVSGCFAVQNGKCVGEIAGDGPTISQPYGLALQADGSAIVADAGLLGGFPQALFRVDLDSGDRELLFEGPSHGLVAVVPPPGCGPLLGAITGVTIMPEPATESDSLTVTVKGHLPCRSSIATDIVNVTVVDSQIRLEVLATAADPGYPLACTTVIREFSLTGVLGMLPQGAYTITARLLVNSSPAHSFVSALHVCGSHWGCTILAEPTHTVWDGSNRRVLPTRSPQALFKDHSP